MRSYYPEATNAQDVRGNSCFLDLQTIQLHEANEHFKTSNSKSHKIKMFLFALNNRGSLWNPGYPLLPLVVWTSRGLSPLPF